MERLLKTHQQGRALPVPAAAPPPPIMAATAVRKDVKTPAHTYRDLVQLPINRNQPLTMHIDLNSCFSTIEQQANPLIRHKPVAVAAYTRDSGIVLAASYEAKALGIKLGTPVREAKQICPGIIVLMPDPPKYREAHRRFKTVLTRYTSDVAPKSIDEFVMDFHGSQAVQAGRSLTDIGYEIKQRIREELGEYVSVNVGIGTNRFLAKLAAGLHKPNGLDVITQQNLLEVYKSQDLLALPGINRRFKARLLAAGISTPYEMYQASGRYLRDFVFFSKLGFLWHQRLRGWEVDSAEWGVKTIGHQYALEHKTTDREEIKRLLMKLCEKTGRRLRRNGYVAYGVNISLRFTGQGLLTPRTAADIQGAGAIAEAPTDANGQPLKLRSGGWNGWGHHMSHATFWQESRKSAHPLYATQEIYQAAAALLQQARFADKVSQMSIHVFNLRACEPEQLGLFDERRSRHKALAQAADDANDRYGEFSVVPASMAGMDKTILDRIAFGNVRDV